MPLQAALGANTDRIVVQKISRSLAINRKPSAGGFPLKLKLALCERCGSFYKLRLDTYTATLIRPSLWNMQVHDHDVGHSLSKLLKVRQAEFVDAEGSLSGIH